LRNGKTIKGLLFLLKIFVKILSSVVFNKTEENKMTYYSRAQSYSRSYNAERAEEEGRYPLTRAIRVVAARYGITKSAARKLLELSWQGEWHHVGKYANEINYYDTNICELCREDDDLLELVTTFVAESATRRNGLNGLLFKLTEEADAYYNAEQERLADEAERARVLKRTKYWEDRIVVESLRQYARRESGAICKHFDNEQLLKESDLYTRNERLKGLFCVWPPCDRKGNARPFPKLKQPSSRIVQ
jgi:hypothetical protein